MSDTARQYKEKISDYRNWEQLEHTVDYMHFPENVGKDMSLDETCLSNGEVYTVLTNKAAHGGKGALAAMVRGVASDIVCGIFRKIPYEIRRTVQTVTTDLSSAMMLTAKTAFLAATLINDRFHVQKLVSDAIDQMRIRYRCIVTNDNENNEHDIIIETNG